MSCTLVWLCLVVAGEAVKATGQAVVIEDVHLKPVLVAVEDEKMPEAGVIQPSGWWFSPEAMVLVWMRAQTEWRLLRRTTAALRLQWSFGGKTS